MIINITPSMNLDRLLPHHPMKVAKIHLHADEAAWVRAVGIYEGEEITVLRAGLFGGPLHVRTGCGGEFALDRTLAAAIELDALHDASEAREAAQ